MYMMILLAVLGLVRWVQSDRYQYLLLASASVFALTLVRYEGWIMAMALIGVVGYVCVRKGYALVKGDQRGQGTTLAFAFLPVLGIGGWMLWNRLIFGDWLNWLHGQYSSQDQVNSLVLNQVGNLDVAALTYWYGMVHILTVPLVGLAAIGLAVMLVKERLSPLFAVIVSTLVPGVFLVYGLYSGGQPMQVAEIDGSIYNLRFGVVMLIPVSIFVGYLAAQLPGRFWVRSIVTLVCAIATAGYTATAFATDGGRSIITNQEAHEAVGQLTEQRELSAWLAANTSGRILAQAFENERVVFDVQGRVVYEGTPDWENALADPTRADIEVVVMRTPTPDTVTRRLQDAAVMSAWTIIHQTPNYTIYTR